MLILLIYAMEFTVTLSGKFYCVSSGERDFSCSLPFNTYLKGIIAFETNSSRNY